MDDALTYYYILTDDTHQVIPCLVVWSALDPQDPNLQSITDHLPPGIDPSEVRVPKFAPQELKGVTFTMPGDDGLKYRAKVIKKIEDFDADNHQHIKFLVEVADHEEIISYTELCDLIKQQDIPPEDKIWTFKEIIDHSSQNIRII